MFRKQPRKLLSFSRVRVAQVLREDGFEALRSTRKVGEAVPAGAGQPALHPCPREGGALSKTCRSEVEFHVWMAPLMQGLLERDGKDEVACGHVSGLLARHAGRWP